MAKLLRKLLWPVVLLWLYNFPEYLAKELNVNIIIGSPWTLISYPFLNIKPLLDEIHPRLAVAVGLAMRGIS